MNNSITPEELGEVAAFLITMSAEQAADETFCRPQYQALDSITQVMIREAYMLGYMRRAREVMEGQR